MNREIKFRAFVKHEKLQLMIEDVAIHPVSQSIGCYHDDIHALLEETDWEINEDYEFVNKITGDKVSQYEMKIYDTGEDYFLIENTENMQFVGLKDKNEKDIYEGDILREDGYLFVVEWDQKWAKFKLTSVKVVQYPEWNRGVMMEVIGNIHQNPDLLK